MRPPARSYPTVVTGRWIALGVFRDRTAFARYGMWISVILIASCTVVVTIARLTEQ